MTITAIKQQKTNDDRVSLFVDSKYSFSLNFDQLLKEKLKKGIEIDESRLQQLKKLSSDGKLRQRTMEWLVLRPHSAFETKNYLYKKKVEPEQIAMLIEDFTEKKYLNDEDFARWFIQQRTRKNKSSRHIISELRSKGVSSTIIDELLSGNDDLSDRDALEVLVAKLSVRTRYQDRKKLTAHLIGKGFRYSLVKEVVDSQLS